MTVMNRWLYRNVTFPLVLGWRGWKKRKKRQIRSLVWGMVLGLVGLVLGGCQSTFVAQDLALPQEGYRMSVQSVVNGNTLEAIGVESVGGGGLPDWKGKRVRVRLIGIEAPDLGQSPWGEEARQFLGEQVGLGAEDSLGSVASAGQESRNDRLVLISLDTQVQDAYDRVLGYVWTEDGLVNEAIVAAGHALARSYFPNVKYEAVLGNAQVAARLLSQGIWNPDQPLRETPAAFRQRKKSRKG